MNWILLLIGFCGMCCPSCNSDPGELGPNHIDSLEVHFNMQWGLQWDSEEDLWYYEGDSNSLSLNIHSRQETFNRRLKIKTRELDRDDLYEVIRVSQLRDHTALQMVFRKEDPLRIHKMTFSKQHLDGNTFIEILSDRFIYRFIYSSHQEGDGYEKLGKNNLFENQLIYTLRSLKFAEGLEFSCKVLPSIQTGKVPLAVQTKFNVSKTINGNWLVQLTYPKRWSRYYFSADYPNELLALEQQYATDSRLGGSKLK